MEISRLIELLKENGFTMIGDSLFEKNIENINFMCAINDCYAEFYIISNQPRCNTTPIDRLIFEMKSFDDVEFTFEHILRKFFLDITNKFVLSFKQGKSTI